MPSATKSKRSRSTNRKRGQDTFLGMPMNWEWDVPKMMRNYWNPGDDRIFPPKVFGIGWDVNSHALLRRLGLISNGSTGE